MAEHVLVKFEGNWADEMDVKGFDIVDKVWWGNYVSKLPDKPFSRYVGSNQDIEWSGKADYLRDFTVMDISEEEVAIIKKFFPYGSFGKVVWVEDFEEDEEE